MTQVADDEGNWSLKTAALWGAFAFSDEDKVDFSDAPLEGDSDSKKRLSVQKKIVTFLLVAMMQI